MHLPNNTLLQGGKYRIVRFISAGGFGCTYEAEHVKLHKKVAIKEFFVKDFCNRDETTSQVSVGITTKQALVGKLKSKFLDEASSLCSLQHPNIVHVSDVFEENGTAYYVMDFIDGPSLNDLVKKVGPLTEQRAVGYILQVAEALKYVHSQNRLHLDIKPGNIMIDENDKAILIDFGASKQYDEVDGENTSTLLGKTPGYAPLEQMGNDVVKFLPSTDIYALGATLYKLVTGITPPSASLLASGESLEDMPSSLSAGTRNAVILSMQTNKLKRPQSIDEFLQILNGDEDYSFHDDIDDENTIYGGEKQKKKQKKPKKKQDSGSKDKKANNIEDLSEVNEEHNATPSSKEKFGLWLNIFLTLITLSGIASAIIPIFFHKFLPYANELVASGMVLIGVMQCILCFVTLSAFKKRKPDAVFLGKLCIIVPFVTDLVLFLSADNGVSDMQTTVKSLVWCVIWFIYLCVSKRVEAIIPSSCRRILKRDYIISGIFAILAIYILAFNKIGAGSIFGLGYVTNEIYEHKGEAITYTGDVKDSIPHGKGTAIYPHGTYEGEYVDGVRHGKGVFRDAEGGVFTGTFAEDDYYQGKYVRKDGVYYEGTFKKQQPYNGTWYEKNGAVISSVKNGK